MSMRPTKQTALHPIAVCTILLILSPCAFSQTLGKNSFPVQNLQNRLDRLIQDLEIPGALLGFEQNGERWFIRSGVANLETQDPITEDHQFRLASITKSFTAALILKLAEMGKLSLDDTLEQWLPGIIENGENITITRLLNHTSGLYDHENTPEMMEKNLSEPTYPWTEEEIVQLINRYPPNFEPGTDYSYCNSGYYLLGMIAEKAASDSVDRLTQQYLFAPAGIGRTRLERNGALQAPSTPGYVRFDEIQDRLNVGDWDLSWDWTAGSGVSTANDLITWVRALFSGKILNAESLQVMTTPLPPAEKYAFGIEISKKGLFGMGSSDLYELTHNGYNPGTFTNWSYFPELDLIFVFALNYSEYRSESISTFMMSVIEAMLEIFDEALTTPSVVSLDYDLYR